MSRPHGFRHTELTNLRHALTKTKRGIDIWNERFREGLVERVEKVAELEARIAELEQQQTEKEIWEDQK